MLKMNWLLKINIYNKNLFKVNNVMKSVSLVN